MSTLLEQMGGGLPGLSPMALAAALTGAGTPITPNSAASLFGQITVTSPQKEALCTICDKSFCNRFFLRTHMEKKHGLILDETNSPQKTASPLSGTAFPFLPPSTSVRMPTQSVIVNGNEEGTPRKIDRMETDDDEAEAAQSKENPLIRCSECNEMFDSMEVLQQHVTIAHGGITRQLLSGLLPPGFPNNPLAILHQGVSPPKTNTSGRLQKQTYARNRSNYCELCNRQIDNKYFLPLHMLKMHRIMIDRKKLVIVNIDEYFERPIDRK